ncbi:serpin B3 [Caerostris extrusa]|uniref:Serpin B3 n=1 Tax=Caerostris extrusa TaxID=172846 RepID=A0AAV4WC29_CAEEX|nr:serpin B3 [Caerostris extrusa]
MIPKLLDFLDPSTVMVILNAVYFKGSWLKPFDAEDTSLQNFNIRGEKDNYKKVQTMFMIKRFMFVEEDNYKALQLPYKGGDISMLILLPDKESNLEEFENSLCPTFLCDLTKNMRERTVSVALPKFELEYSKSLKESFLSLGLESIFCQAANLEGISETGNLLVSNIIHKAVLVVNEVGSEAAAVSEIEIVPYCMNPDFYADHPFMFVIYNVKSNLILFMGRVNDL